MEVHFSMLGSWECTLVHLDHVSALSSLLLHFNALASWEGTWVHFGHESALGTECIYVYWIIGVYFSALGSYTCIWIMNVHFSTLGSLECTYIMGVQFSALGSWECTSVQCTWIVGVRLDYWSAFSCMSQVHWTALAWSSVLKCYLHLWNFEWTVFNLNDRNSHCADIPSQGFVNVVSTCIPWSKWTEVHSQDPIALMCPSIVQSRVEPQ